MFGKNKHKALRYIYSCDMRATVLAQVIQKLMGSRIVICQSALAHLEGEPQIRFERLIESGKIKQLVSDNGSVQGFLTQSDGILELLELCMPYRESVTEVYFLRETTAVKDFVAAEPTARDSSKEMILNGMCDMVIYWIEREDDQTMDQFAIWVDRSQISFRDMKAKMKDVVLK